MHIFGHSSHSFWKILKMKDLNYSAVWDQSAYQILSLSVLNMPNYITFYKKFAYSVIPYQDICT